MITERTYHASELHRKAVTLCEGGSVQVSGLMVRAKRVPDEEFACQLCEMDSACDREMCDLCAECDGYDRHKHILYLYNQETMRAYESKGHD